MSERRLKRTIVNGARAHIKKAIKPLIKFNLGEDRDKEIERRKDHERAISIFDKWKTEFVNTRQTPDDIVNSLNDLAARIDTGIETKEMREFIVKELIMPCIARSHELNLIVQSATVWVGGKCECGNKLEDEVPLRAWLDKAFNLECNICSKMTEASDLKKLEGPSKRKGRK